MYCQSTSTSRYSYDETQYWSVKHSIVWGPEASPHGNEKAKREKEFKGLLDKIQLDIITLNPDFIGGLALPTKLTTAVNHDDSANFKTILSLSEIKYILGDKKLPLQIVNTGTSFGVTTSGRHSCKTGLGEVAGGKFRNVGPAIRAKLDLDKYSGRRKSTCYVILRVCFTCASWSTVYLSLYVWTDHRATSINNSLLILTHLTSLIMMTINMIIIWHWQVLVRPQVILINYHGPCSKVGRVVIKSCQVAISHTIIMRLRTIVIMG
ncbi:hypothetical protein BDR07DRAFT_1379430 [Suillus spraguei]|nr:hypothetical protein BDR07DRAFT_1379430 [Suillus spraguei]